MLWSDLSAGFELDAGVLRVTSITSPFLCGGILYAGINSAVSGQRAAMTLYLHITALIALIPGLFVQRNRVHDHGRSAEMRV